jgi:hypothetical protein
MAKISVKRDTTSKTWFVYRDGDDIEVSKAFNITLDLLAKPSAATTAPPAPQALATTALFVLDVPQANQSQSLRLRVNPGVWGGSTAPSIASPSAPSSIAFWDRSRGWRARDSSRAARM